MTDVKISRGARRAAIGLLVLTLDNADQAALRAPPAQRPKGAYSLALITDFRNLRQEFCGSGR